MQEQEKGKSLRAPAHPAISVSDQGHLLKSVPPVSILGTELPSTAKVADRNALQDRIYAQSVQSWEAEACLLGSLGYRLQVCFFIHAVSIR